MIQEHTTFHKDHVRSMFFIPVWNSRDLTTLLLFASTKRQLPRGHQSSQLFNFAKVRNNGQLKSEGAMGRIQGNLTEQPDYARTEICWVLGVIETSTWPP